MKKEGKEIIKYLIDKELKALKQEEEEILFPSLPFLKSAKAYEQHLISLKRELE